jgi:hypothetical protein
MKGLIRSLFLAFGLVTLLTPNALNAQRKAKEDAPAWAATSLNAFEFRNVGHYLRSDCGYCGPSYGSRDILFSACLKRSLENDR